jgi:hypothetical protein
MLEQALTLCDGGDLGGHPAAARTHLHLGVVYVGGLKSRARGVAELKRALAIDPTIVIEESLQNPEVRSAFAEAVAGLPEVPLAPALTRPSLANPSAAKPRGQALGIVHPPRTHAVRGRPIHITAQIPPGLAAARVVLAYQAADGDMFLAREMAPRESALGWYEAEIPAEATLGRYVTYYLEAQNPEDQPIATHGTPEHPHLVALAPEPVSEQAAPRPTALGLWLVLAVGSGGGYHSGTPEMNPQDAQYPPRAIHVSGFGLASAAHLAPEIGFFPRTNFLLSAQARLQYVAGAEDVHVGELVFHPATLAVAGLAKLSLFLSPVSQRLHAFVTVQAGLGQIRHAVTTPASADLSGCAAATTCKDTVMGGLGLAGLGAGITWTIDRSLAMYGAVEVLAGMPDFMVNGDLNLGVAIML